MGLANCAPDRNCVGHSGIPEQRVTRKMSVLMIGAVLCGTRCTTANPSDKTFTIRKMSASSAIDVTDRTLSDWSPTYLVWSMDQKDAAKSQWSQVRDHSPAKVQDGDVGIELMSALASTDWLIAFRLTDDRSVPSAWPRNEPQGGDCFEIFIAGEHQTSGADMHDLVALRGGDTDAAFLQLTLPLADGVRGPDVISPWRTDRKLIEHLAQADSRFSAEIWRIGNHQWAGEVRIPTEIFSAAVRDSIRAKNPLRFAFDYLDYDNEPAGAHDVPPDYGYRPDNVFSHDNNEKNVNAPAFMPSLVFD